MTAVDHPSSGPVVPGLWADTKFRWLIASVAVVGVFEILSLGGWHLPSVIEPPFFAAVIIAIGHRTLWTGARARSKPTSMPTASAMAILSATAPGGNLTAS